VDRIFSISSLGTGRASALRDHDGWASLLLLAAICVIGAAGVAVAQAPVVRSRTLGGNRSGRFGDGNRQVGQLKSCPRPRD